MKIIIATSALVLILMSTVVGQTERVEIASKIRGGEHRVVLKRVSESLSSYLVEDDDSIEETVFVHKDFQDETWFLLKSIRRSAGTKSEANIRIINFYPHSEFQYRLKLSVTKKDRFEKMFSLNVYHEGDQVRFGSPIRDRTFNWRSKQVGTVKYVYGGALDIASAEQFNLASIRIALKFKLKPFALTYYKCASYQEALFILGIDHDSESAGVVQSSEAFNNTIVTGVNTENFAHDVFHMYIYRKFPDQSVRSFLAEEGYANSIADAYYSKKDGNTIQRRELVKYLKQYLKENPDVSILDLFRKNPRVYFPLKDQVTEEVFQLLSVKSTISSLICDEVEQVKGFDGLIKLLRSGRSEADFLRVTKELINLDQSNFDKRVGELIRNFSEKRRT